MEAQSEHVGKVCLRASKILESAPPLPRLHLHQNTQGEQR